MQYLWKCIFLISWLLVSTVSIAKTEPLEPNWGQHNHRSTTEINHRPWQKLLDTYLQQGPNDVYLFHYGSVTTADKTMLNKYLDYLQGIPIHTYNRDEQLAYWINLYNAKLVSIILNNYPVDSITSINPSHNPFEIGPFSTKTLRVLGYPLSLRDINMQILHKFWQDPRINFALCTGSIGSPPLRPAAYQGKELEQALNEATTAFVNHINGVQIQYHRIKTSKLFFWFKSDFGHSDRDIIHFIQRYAKPELSQQIHGKHSISGSFYDWGLNG